MFALMPNKRLNLNSLNEMKIPKVSNNSNNAITVLMSFTVQIFPTNPWCCRI